MLIPKKVYRRIIGVSAINIVKTYLLKGIPVRVEKKHTISEGTTGEETPKAKTLTYSIIQHFSFHIYTALKLVSIKSIITVKILNAKVMSFLYNGIVPEIWYVVIKEVRYMTKILKSIMVVCFAVLFVFSLVGYTVKVYTDIAFEQSIRNGQRVVRKLY